MITKAGLSIAVLAALCFGGSFLSTVATQTPSAEPLVTRGCPPLVERLDLDPEQAEKIQALDPLFAEEIKDLRTKLERTRSALATVFENELAGDDEIRAGVEAVIAAHNDVERRVAEYLITVRDHLTPVQQKRLFGVCAAKVRECSRRWRCGQDCQRTDTSSPACPSACARRCGKNQPSPDAGPKP